MVVRNFGIYTVVYFDLCDTAGACSGGDKESTGI